jgi:tRNA U54 and U55 pseudouridine synthase Pus10
MDINQAHKVFYMSDEQRWRKIRELLQAMNDCPAENVAEENLCRDCISRLSDIEEVADMAIAAIDGPSR